MKRLIKLALFVFFFVMISNAQWVQTNGPEGGLVGSLTIDSTNTSNKILYAKAGLGDVYKSTNDGVSWSLISVGLPSRVDINVLKQVNNGLFAAVRPSNVTTTLFKTTDGGATWIESRNGLPITGVIRAFANIADTIFVGTTSGVYKSSDGGANWSAARTGMTDTVIYSLLAVDSLLYAGTQSASGNGHIYKSTNRGLNWQEVYAGNTPVTALIKTASFIFGGTFNGIVRSSNQGTSWVDATGGLTPGSVTSILGMTALGNAVYAGTQGGGVIKSTDNGNSWTLVNAGLIDNYGLSIVSDGSNLFLGSFGGVFLSTNNGTSWTAVNTGLMNTYVSALIVSGANLFAGTQSGVFLSSNDGTSWAPVNTGLTNISVNAFAVSGSNLFAGTFGGVFLSTNNGANWTAVNTGLTNLGVGALTVSGTNLFAGTYGGGVFLSTNNGISWTLDTVGLTDLNVSALAVSGSNLFAGTSGGVFLSTNNGANWTAVNTGLTNLGVGALTVSGTNLFAGIVYGGVFLSTNSGTSWTAVNTGLTKSDVRALAFSGTYLSAGTSGGVFLSIDNGTSWSTVSSALNNTYVISLAVSGTKLFAGTYRKSVWSFDLITVPPTPPQNLVVTDSSSGSVTIKWRRNVESDFLRYRIYRGTSPNPVTKVDSTAGGNINDTSKTFTGLVNGTRYYFRITAVDSAGNESAYSNEVNASPTQPPPTIISFSPISGPIGTTVTITGTNFNSTPVNNIVYFGAVRAAVTGGTTTSLTVNVPYGATYMPISVTDSITGLTAYSNVPFDVTFPSAQIIVVASYLAKVDFTTGTSPYDVAIGDLDGDGKADLAVTNYSGNTISIFRNTSVSGSITSGSFAAKVDFTTGLAPNGVAIGDVDGDGKLDLAVTNYSSNTISIFRNTSVSGSITSGSFAAKVDFTTGLAPNGVAIGDVDGDGKPDLAVTNWGNGISIFRNTSVTGSITSGSFAAKVDFTTGTNPYGVAIGDLDGDGKADLAVTNYSGNTISIFRNTSVSGSITSGSFAAKVDFTTGLAPIDVAIGDVDGDGKPDLAVTNYSSNTISIFRNTSVSGSITSGSFAAKVDFTTGLAPIGVAIGEVNGDGKPDLAVTNQGSNSTSIFRNTSVSGSIASGSFAAKVDFTTGPNPYGVAIGDLDRDGKPDLAVANWGSSTVSLLRNVISPIRAPQNLSVVDSSSRQITIRWNKNPGLNTLRYRIYRSTSPGAATLVDSTTGALDTTKTVAGLVNGTRYYFRVTAVDTASNESDYSNEVNAKPGDYIAPAAPQNLATTDSSNGSVTIKWRKNAEPDFLRYRIYRGTSPNPVTKVDSTAGGNLSDTSKTFTGLVNGTRYYIRITAVDSSQNESSYSNEISATPVAPPTISSFLPASGPLGTTVTISGTNFSTNASNNIIYFGGVKTVVNAATSTLLSATVPTGATFSPITVTANNATAFSSKPFIVTFASGGVIDTLSFVRKVNFPTALEPIALATGDFDGDGKLDLVVANAGGDSLSIYRNIISGDTITASSFSARLTLPTGSLPYSVAVGDLDGDGKLDLAATNNGSNTISIFRNTSSPGSISFDSKVDFVAGTNPYSIAIRDIDADGRPDLVVANISDATVSVFKNTGTSGTFTTSSFSPKVDFAVGTAPYSVAVADIDGDGKADIATANYSAGSLSVLRNTSSGSTVSFATKIDFTAGLNPDGIAVGDVDGDGKIDIAVANRADSSVSILRNTSSSGSISMAAKVDFRTGQSPYGIAFTDLTGDGKIDLVSANAGSRTVSVLKNTSTSGTIAGGSFASKVDLAVGIGPEFVAIGDADGDGKPDLAVANSADNTISLLKNVMAPPFSPPTITSFAPSSGPAGASVTITGTNFSSVASNNTVYIGGTKATVTAASTTSLTVIVPAGTTFAPITVTTNALTAFSVKPFVLTFPGGGVINSSSLSTKVDFGVGNNQWGIAVGDIDGDGKPDIIVPNADDSSFSVLRNTGNVGSITSGSFASKIDFRTGKGPLYVALGDLDGDGLLDVAVPNATDNTISVYRNTSSVGSISFAPKLDLAAGLEPRAIAIIDIDADGKPDIGVANYRDATISVFKNKFDVGSISSTSFGPRTDFSLGTNGPYSIAAADIDADDKPDFVTPSLSGKISILGNTSSPGQITTSSFATHVDFAGGSFPNSVAVGDLDGDGKLDLVVGTNDSVLVYRNTSAVGTISTSSFASKVGFYGSGLSDRVALGDIDGDGKLDIVTANEIAATVTVLRNTAAPGTVNNNSFAPSVNFPGVYGALNVAVGDFDRDGRTDIAATSRGTLTGLVSVLRNNVPASSAPAAPQNLVVTDSSSKTITVKWKKNTEADFLRCRIYRATSPSPTAKVDSTTGGIADTSKTFTGLTNGTRYYFRVTAVDSSGNESGYSAEVNAAPADRVAPSAPQSLAVFDSTSTKIGMRWKKNSDADFLRYRIYRGTSPNPTAKVDSTTGGITDTTKLFTGLTNGTRYYLRVTAVDSSGNESAYSNEVNGAPNAALAVDDLFSQIPKEYSLSQNYPNPFNPSTVIRYGLPTRSRVKLQVYDLLGRQIFKLVDEEQDARFYEKTWQASVSSGLYFYRLEAISTEDPNKSFVQVRKMLMLK